MSTILSNKINQIVVFSLGELEFGVEITEIKEIIKMTRIVKLPEEIEYIEGIINLRGSVTPIINLRKRFNIPDSYSDQDRIIISENDGKQIGFIVDSVTEVLKIDNDSIHAPQGKLSEVEKYLVGIGKVNNRILLIINLYSLLTNTRVIDLQQMNSNAEGLVEKQ
ncbi:MAG: chemotaxis protein CheW [Firmicutes bacterium HGW-Firmicutes-13]|nr:MAG: chemotaxis protein CheW [Firmicutes bacterium HGW-Firmicutes-13]